MQLDILSNYLIGRNLELELKSFKRLADIIYRRKKDRFPVISQLQIEIF